MAQRPRTTRQTASTPAPVNAPGALRFSAINAILLAAGFAAIVAGYVLLAQGSNVAAPVLLVLGYAILIPLGIIL
ncbi:MAG TPA: hypothetical protein VGD27_03825 [Longimicrobiales bacterium]